MTPLNGTLAAHRGSTPGNSTGGCSFEPESGLVMTSENRLVEVFNYGSEAFFR